MTPQRTLRRATSCAGIGLHSGHKVSLTLRPAPADTGIRVRRVDLGGVEVPAHVSHVSGISYATVLSADGVRIETVEHLLSALVSQGIDFETGQISITDAQETWIVVTTIAYFLLSATQAWLSNDIAPGNWRTTVIGYVKALTGIVATILLTYGIDIVDSTPVMVREASSILSSVLYGAYLVLSAIQAFLTKMKDVPANA